MKNKFKSHEDLLAEIVHRKKRLTREQATAKTGRFVTVTLKKGDKTVRVNALANPASRGYLPRLIKEHGTCSCFASRGFILPDGECLCLNGDDHRIICGVQSFDPEEKLGSRWAGMKWIGQRTGLIRWMPEGIMPSVELYKEPTREQLRTISELAEAGKLKEVACWKRGKEYNFTDWYSTEGLVEDIEGLYR